MRLRAFRLIGVAAAVMAGLLAHSEASPATNDVVQVTVDKARVARIPDKTETLIVGQPGIADVTMLKNSSMGVITGKSFGETNLIALDAKGDLLGEWTVRVGASKPDLLLQNGLNQESFICNPQCLPTIDLADAKAIAANRTAAVAAHNAFAMGK
ncbi:pilus assembly protein N-terminal domain-containing protein [Rhodoblastus acidophilus]|uniref:Pilus assembly protein N-terminal domain-containing protein n=1 Tax=Candidatus Rhodoblastus alkanivorans TaxID=2954117 RepID=A0ABS9ZAH5_9HYPH|nr:pilus assembly protein N-terminal domain-containing protein [Candidatus Rhodoblastus alkanivorans]MCI4677799.1 pilus assembly protein N-terminal domain-containing protein [Candidatus Rhodoblastus alkanivorans]MCI4684703.1 pilus assembly protein N-terminal domain-containing protein [Candidatus Rhodoblastus alkanivorans]MDI4642025.1 pilus assembly protein N-terminal domain-containing protein [Rhodoblastus acidophilus]